MWSKRKEKGMKTQAFCMFQKDIEKNCDILCCSPECKTWENCSHQLRPFGQTLLIEKNRKCIRGNQSDKPSLSKNIDILYPMDILLAW